jgi:hypothetical protein
MAQTLSFGEAHGAPLTHGLGVLRPKLWRHFEP